MESAGLDESRLELEVGPGQLRRSKLPRKNANDTKGIQVLAFFGGSSSGIINPTCAYFNSTDQ